MPRLFAPFILAIGALLAESAAERPVFEVASVKLSQTNLDTATFARVGVWGGPGTPDPGQLNCENVTLRLLLAKAYGVKNYQISGPAWMDSARYEIVAKVPNGATKEESNLMLQSLLEERFHLALRREQKELPVYALVTGKNGPKMKEVPEDDPSQASGAPGAAGGSTPGGMSPARPATASAGLALGPGSMSIAAPDNSGRRPRMTAKKRNMQWLADILTLQLDRPVMDMTGLTARYDFSLDFSPQRQGDSSADGDAGISIFTAVQEQLGLKLEARKAPVEILVIDRAEKTPTGN